MSGPEIHAHNLGNPEEAEQVGQKLTNQFLLQHLVPLARIASTEVMGNVIRGMLYEMSAFTASSQGLAGAASILKEAADFAAQAKDIQEQQSAETTPTPTHTAPRRLQ